MKVVFTDAAVDDLRSIAEYLAANLSERRGNRRKTAAHRDRANRAMARERGQFLEAFRILAV